MLSSSSSSLHLRRFDFVSSIFLSLLLLVWSNTILFATNMTVHAIDCGCPNTCTDEAQAEKNGAPWTCGQRIAWLMAAHQNTELEACEYASKHPELDDESNQIKPCRYEACYPEGCQSVTTTTTTSTTTTTTTTTSNEEQQQQQEDEAEVIEEEDEEDTTTTMASQNEHSDQYYQQDSGENNNNSHHHNSNDSMLSNLTDREQTYMGIGMIMGFVLIFTVVAIAIAKKRRNRQRRQGDPKASFDGDHDTFRDEPSSSYSDQEMNSSGLEMRPYRDHTITAVDTNKNNNNNNELDNDSEESDGDEYGGEDNMP